MAQEFSYGGQAVIEGVMMRGKTHLAVAVRRPDGEIALDRRRLEPISDKYKFLKLPILRGFVALIESLVLGLQALSYSANQSVEEEEEQLSPWEMTITMGLAFLLAVVLFIITPTALSKLVEARFPDPLVQNLLEGLLRVVIFLVYIVAISRMKDIQRVFQYHGAEHKTIHAHEAGLPLTVANVQRFGTLHPRCGTSFLLIVMVISVFVFALLGKQVLWWRILSRVLLMPVVAGLAYELIKFSGKHCEHPLVAMLIAPGLWLQKLTTREPDDDMVEVAIASLQAVLPERINTDGVEEDNVRQT